VWPKGGALDYLIHIIIRNLPLIMGRSATLPRPPPTPSLRSAPPPLDKNNGLGLRSPQPCPSARAGGGKGSFLKTQAPQGGRGGVGGWRKV